MSIWEKISKWWNSIGKVDDPNERPDIEVEKWGYDSIRVGVKTFCWGMDPTRPAHYINTKGRTPQQCAIEIKWAADQLQTQVDKWRENEAENTKRFENRLAEIRAKNKDREQIATPIIREAFRIVKTSGRNRVNGE